MAMGSNWGRTRRATLAAGLLALAMSVSACTQSTQASATQPAADAAKAAEQVKAKDQEITTLKGQLAAAQKEKDQEITTLRGQLTSAQKDGGYWKELAAFLKPVEMKSMTDHRAFMTPSGLVMALHFDNMNLNQAQHLNWLALGLPGKFCKEDQEALEKAYGKGFTHFHDMKADTHGGAKGAEGVWFVHSAVREFDSPMSGGVVKPGVDLKFMPTAAQSCS